MKILKTIKRTLESIVLCIRFPFLYPRHRLYGTHYVNYKLVEYHKHNYPLAYKGSTDGSFTIECVDRWLAFKIRVVDFIEEYLVQIFHFIPTYTELDSMPEGWRKSFGIQMCKEIKKALKKDHLLYSYRITQIKEKFGGLRWYDNNGNKEVDNIINKYEDISYNICIDCGKPATCYSCGWISPYCDECGKKQPYKLVKTLDEVIY